MATASLVCSCPFALSRPGKPGDPRTFLQVPPDCVRDAAKRLTAHTGRACLHASGSPRTPLIAQRCRWGRSRSTRSSSPSIGVPVFTDNLLPSSATPAGSLPSFAMWPAFPASDYYGGSATIRRHQRTTRLPAARRREGRQRIASHVHPVTGRRVRCPALLLQHRHEYAWLDPKLPPF